MEPITVFAFVLAALGLLTALVVSSRSRRPDPAGGSAQQQQTQARLEQERALIRQERDLFDQKWHGVTAQVSKDLTGLSRVVTDLKQEWAVQHEGLAQQLSSAGQQQQQLLEAAGKLNDILLNPQARGQWGERMADDILRAAGMKEGVNYLKQKTTGAGTRPDFTFRLPGGLDLHMDVKFPLEGYVRYLEAPSDPERDRALKSFGQAVRGHVKALASRDEYKESTDAVGFVLMFIPNDGVYAFIHEHHGQVFAEALRDRVVVCSPSTLFAMLALVRQAMETIALERSSQEILEHLSNFTDQWEKYVEKYELVEKRLRLLGEAFDDLTGVRSRQLQRQLDRIEDLKTRSGQIALLPSEPDRGV